MPYSKEHKEQSRQRILASAIGLFTERGFDNTSIDQIMVDAGMTRGAFYAHFKNKSDLYAKAILGAAMQSAITDDKPDNLKDEQWLDLLLKGYLSKQHVNQEQPPCPLAFLATDVASRDPMVRKTYTRVYQGMIKLMGRYTDKKKTKDEQLLYAVTAMMIGGVAVARAIDSEKTRSQLLTSCARTAQSLLSINAI